MRSRLAAVSFLVYVLLIPTSPAQNLTGDQDLPHGPPVQQLPQASDRYALLVGVDRYDDLNIGSLSDPSHDVEVLRQSLIKYGLFDADNITVLSTKAGIENAPLRSRILRALAGLENTVPENALLVFMFSGHGETKGDAAYLIPQDFYSTDNPILLKETALAVEDVREAIARTHVKQAIVILDACRNDPDAKSKGMEGNVLTKAYTDGFDFRHWNKGIEASAVIYATQLGAQAWVDSNSNLGYLTEALTDGLMGKAADPSGVVTLGSLVQFIQKSVPTKVKTDHPGRVQRPFAVVSGYLPDNLVVAHVPKSVTLSIPDPAAVGQLADRNNAPKVDVDTNSVPMNSSPNSRPTISGSQVDATQPVPLQVASIDYASQFAANLTDELALGNLGKSAFERGDYSWTIKLLEQARKVQHSKVWMARYPYLAASYWLADHDDEKFRSTLQEMIDNMQMANTFLSHSYPISLCIATMETVRRLLPSQQADEIADFVYRAQSLASNLNTAAKEGREQVCTLYGEANSGNPAWLKTDSCTIPNVAKLDRSFQQHDFHCCGGGATSPTSNTDIPAGLEIVVAGGEYWSVANPVLATNKLTLTTYCGPPGGFPPRGCNVKATIYAHYKY